MGGLARKLSCSNLQHEHDICYASQQSILQNDEAVLQHASGRVLGLAATLDEEEYMQNAALPDLAERVFCRFDTEP